MMDKANDYNQLFESFRIAGRAFHRLQLTGPDASDRELARNPDYLQLHRAGMQIAVIGGEAAINGAIQSICKEQSGNHEIARAELERLWCGMGHWRN